MKAGAAATTNYEAGAKTFVFAEGGMAIEAAIGAQKFFFFPAVMGRGKNSEETPGETRRSSGKSKSRKDGSRKGRATAPGSKKTAKRQPR